MGEGRTLCVHFEILLVQFREARSMRTGVRMQGAWLELLAKARRYTHDRGHRDTNYTTEAELFESEEKLPVTLLAWLGGMYHIDFNERPFSFSSAKKIYQLPFARQYNTIPHSETYMLVEEVR